ncbi:MAG: response regulator [bacterium]
MTSALAQKAHSPVVLLVEDEFLLRWSLQKALQQRGFQVISAETGKQALLLLASHQVDAFICDHKLPDMEGLEVISRARHLHPQLLYILITAYATPELEQKAQTLGVQYLPKPFNAEDLIHLIVIARELRQTKE